MVRSELINARVLVVKVGSAILTDVRSGLNHEVINQLVDGIAALKARGLDVVLVSSGSIVEGMQRLGWAERPKSVNHLQSAAAVGQMGLVHNYESKFQTHGIRTAQVLLTHADLANRMRYLNARNTLRTLLELNVVPIVNENDTVVTDEIKVGDNDTLGALVANLVEAEALVILTDQCGLFNKDPRQHADAELVQTGTAGDPALLKMAGVGSALGTGGMVTKLTAAEKAARSGAVTIIAYGREADILTRLHDGELLGTYLKPKHGRIAARKQWLAGLQTAQGSVVLDAGAVAVLQNQGRSLLPIGVKSLSGNFSRGEVVLVLDEGGKEVARGLVNYSALETNNIKGLPSKRIEKALGYIAEEELIHRDNMVVF